MFPMCVLLFGGLKKMLFFTNRVLGHFRGGGSLSETRLFQTAGNNFCGWSEDKFWRFLSRLILKTVFLAFSVDVVL